MISGEWTKAANNGNAKGWRDVAGGCTGKELFCVLCDRCGHQKEEK
jgi:hypothetical protein